MLGGLYIGQMYFGQAGAQSGGVPIKQVHTTVCRMPARVALPRPRRRHTAFQLETRIIKKV